MADCTVTLNIGDGPDEAVHPGDVLIHRVVEGVSGGLDILPKALKPVSLRRDPFRTVDLERGKVFRFEFTRHKMTFYKLIPDAPSALYSSLVDATPPPVAPIPTGAELAEDIAGLMVGNYMPIDGQVAPDGVPLRVGTYNIRKSSLDTGVPNQQWSDRRVQCATDALTSAASILAIQEVENADNATTSQAVDLVGLMNTQLGQPGRWVAQIRSSYPAIYDSTVISEPDTGARNYVALNPTLGYRGLATSVFEAGGVSFTFGSLHYNHQAEVIGGTRWSLGRLHAEANAILAAHYAASTGPQIYAGDFNSHLTPLGLIDAGLSPARTVAATVTQSGLPSATAFATTPLRVGRWYDQIVVGRDVSAVAAGMVMTFASGSDYPLKQPMGSDHHCMWADVVIREAV